MRRSSHLNKGVAGMLSRKTSIGVFVALTLVVGGAAACSSSKKSSSTGGSASGSAAGSASGSAAGGDAQSRIASLLNPPTSINITTPLSKKPAAGKNIALVESAE